MSQRPLFKLTAKTYVIKQL